MRCNLDSVFRDEGDESDGGGIAASWAAAALGAVPGSANEDTVSRFP